MLIPREKKFYVISLVSAFQLCFWNCEAYDGDLITSSADLPPAIFAFLNTAADSQYVIISSSLAAEERPSQSLDTEYRRLRQAKVTMEDAGERLVFNKPYEVERFFEKYRYFVFAAARNAHPGTTYHLRVEIPEKGVFTASTTAPGNFEILVPNSVDTIDVFHPLEIRTSISERAAGYRVTLWSHVVDSTDFKLGRRNEVKPVWARSYRYFKAAENPIGVTTHYLRYYYDNPDKRDITLLQLTLSVEALDAPAWLSREIYVDSTLSTVGGNNSGEEFRLEAVSFSNIEGGRGVMTAITTKMIPLLFPPNRK